VRGGFANATPQNAQLRESRKVAFQHPADFSKANIIMSFGMNMDVLQFESDALACAGVAYLPSSTPLDMPLLPLSNRPNVDHSIPPKLGPL
jgi:hypothetical protein